MRQDFATWLLAQHEIDSPAGDLARDARRDQRFPEPPASVSKVRAHLELVGACEGALRACEDAAAEWLRRSTP